MKATETVQISADALATILDAAQNWRVELIEYVAPHADEEEARGYRDSLAELDDALTTIEKETQR